MDLEEVARQNGFLMRTRRDKRRVDTKDRASDVAEGWMALDLVRRSQFVTWPVEGFVADGVVARGIQRVRNETGNQMKNESCKKPAIETKEAR